MSGPILSSNAPILLVGASPISPELVTKTFAYAESVLAVDGGLKTAQRANLPVQHVIGDMDSHTTRVQGITYHQIDDPNTTDFQKALAAVSAPLILGVGFLDGRLDHQLAAFSALINDPRPIILCNECELAFVAPRHLKINAKNHTAAFYPLRPVIVSLKGVKYPLENTQMAPDGIISTSNHITDTTLEITTDRHGLLCILPQTLLPTLIQALSSSW